MRRRACSSACACSSAASGDDDVLGPVRGEAVGGWPQVHLQPDHARAVVRHLKHVHEDLRGAAVGADRRR